MTRLPRSILGALGRRHRSTYSPAPKRIPIADIDQSLFKTPTWSVTELLPEEGAPVDKTITRTKLNHLLRLSALPPPANAYHEEKLLTALHDHLHFVRAAQLVDTYGVSRLARIEDEVDRKPLEWADILAADDDTVPDMGRIEWDPMALPRRKVGGFYVVDGKVTEELDVEEDAIPFA